MVSRTVFCRVFWVCCFLSVESDAAINFSNRESTIKLKNSSAQLILETPISGYRGTLRIDGKNNNSVQGIAASDVITFAEGVVSNGVNEFVLSGVYNPTTGDTIELGDNDTLSVASGDVVQSIVVKGTSGADSVIKGQPTFTSPITINDNINSLKIGIQNKLTQNINLNGGTLTLIDDLSLQDGVFLVGSGTVDLNNFTLSLANSVGSSWSGTLTFKRAEDVRLNGYTVLTGEWNFGDVGGSSYLNGNGNVLDVSGGGTITVADGHTLYLSDIQIKGLGTGKGDFNISSTGTIKMSNVTLELGDNYSHNSGEIYVQGDNCRVISADTSSGNYTFDVSGSGKITVDHAVLFYETLEGQNVSPFSFTDVGTQKNLINGGVIRSAVLDTTPSDIVFDVQDASPTFLTNYDITSQSNIVFTNSLGGAQTMTVDGLGYFLQFPDSAVGMFQIANDLTVTLENVVLKDFNYNVVSYGTGSALNFGNGVVMELNSDTTIGSSDNPWTFTGNAIIEGYGHTIFLKDIANRITINGPYTLKIQNARLQIAHESALSCLSHDAKIELQDVDVCIEEPGYTFALGNIDIKGNVRFRGCNATTPGGSSLFTYSTTGTLSVLKAATLEIVGDINFSYQATPKPSDGTTSPSSQDYKESKRKLVLSDPSATLHLNSCTLTSTATGIALDYGNLVIEDKVVLDIDPTPGSEAEFGTSLDVNIKAGATLEVGGPLKYVPSTFP